MSRVLILNRYRLQSAAFHVWLNPDDELFLINDAAHAVDGSPDGAAIRARYRRIAEFDDYLHDPAVLDTARDWIKSDRIDLVLASSEYDVLRAAGLRSAFGLEGQDLASADAFRDKLVMKQALAAAALPIAPFVALDGAGDLTRFVGEVGLPVVVKPRAGADSQGITILTDPPAVVAFEAVSRPPGELLAEAFVRHELLHCDGVLAHGEIVFHEVWAWSTTILDVRDAPVPTTAVTLDLDDPRRARIVALAAATLAALPSPPVTAFHIEFFDTGDDLLVNEAASRVGGGRIQPTLRRLRGVDIVELTARLQTGQRLERLPGDRTAANGGFLLAYDTGAVRGTAPADCPLPGISHYETCLPLAGLGRADVAAPELLVSGVAVGPSAASVGASLLQLHTWFLDHVDRQPPS